MSISTIFSTIEARLLAQPEFSGWKFFRYESEANSGKQSKGSTPYLKLFWDYDQTTKGVKHWRATKTIEFQLEARWKTDHESVNAIERIEEQDLYNDAVIKSLLGTTASDNFLDLSFIETYRMRSKKLDIQGHELLKHNGIVVEIEVVYYKFK